MGCVSSKRVEVAVETDVYRPPPASIALFDVSTVEEPWLITTAKEEDPKQQQQQEKKAITSVPLALLEKLESYELAPRSWSEVSKALEDLKPSLHQTLPPKASPTRLPPPSSDLKNTPEKAGTFHTLEQLDAQLPSPNQKKAPSSPPRARSPPRPPPPELAGFKPVKENCFIIRDQQERERKKAGGDSAANARWRRRDPLEGYPERCPPGNCDGVVLYTTTVRGVRRTFEDCERARREMEAHTVETGVEVEERDVSLHGEYLKELRELVGEGAALPRLFIRGRYVGGVEEVVELGEIGKLIGRCCDGWR